MRSILYILAATAVVSASKNTLDCDFSERCCWKSTNREDPWTITTGINENEFRRTFLVGRSKPPPAGHYLMRFEGVEASTFESCPFCSNDGFVEVQYRHWQSPLATLELCWRLYNNNDKTEHCERVSSDKQSQLLSRPMKVDKKKNVQLFFRVQSALEEPRAVILIDKIRVRAAPCHMEEHNTKSLSVAKKSKEVMEKEKEQSTEQAQTSFMGSFGGDEVTTALPTTTSRVDRINKMAKKQVQIRQSGGYPSKQKLDDQLLSEIAELEGIEKVLDPHAFDVRVPSAVLPTTHVIQGGVGQPVSVPTPVLPSPAIARPVIVQPVQTPIKIQPVAAPRQAEKVLPQLPLKQAPSIAAAAVIAKSAPGNPLQDLLGEDLTNFLDPEFQFDGSDEKEYEDGDLKQGASPVTPTAPVSLPASPQPLQAQQPSPFAAVPTFSQQSQQSFQPAQQPATASPPSVIGGHPLGALLGHMGMAGEHPLFAHMHNHSLHHECSTPGGCLFERSMCGFRTTGQAVKPFNLTTVGISRFAETTVGANQVSVIEADTQITEAHTIMFDGLNWQAGSRLVGCCFGAGTLQPLFCPFTSPREAGPLQWMNGRFDCMPGTTKIMFMCENYGASPATCGLDNVRLHKITDIFQHYPCQKDLLNSQ